MKAGRAKNFLRNGRLRLKKYRKNNLLIELYYYLIISTLILIQWSRSPFRRISDVEPGEPKNTSSRRLWRDGCLGVNLKTNLRARRVRKLDTRNPKFCSIIIDQLVFKKSRQQIAKPRDLIISGFNFLKL